MPRAARAFPPHSVLHVVNRGNDRRALFGEPQDYEAFLYLIERTLRQIPLRILAYALMPNHWHFVAWPAQPEELTRFMQRVTSMHSARIRRLSNTIGLGHVYQGRFRSFPIEQDDHYFRALRYVEANPLRARLVDRAERWPWSSLRERVTRPRLIVDGPMPLPPAASWLELVNLPGPRPEGSDPIRIS